MTEASGETKPADTVIGLPGSRTVKSKFLLSKPSVYGILYGNSRKLIQRNNM